MKSLDKVFKIIEILKNYKELRLYEVCDLTKFNKSTAHRILNELMGENYVKFNSEGKKYSLGLKFIEISNFLIEDFSLIKASKEIIDNLNNNTQETIHIVSLLGDKLIYIDKREANSFVRMYSRIGFEVPYYCTAVGKVILAYMDKDLQVKIIKSIDFVRRTKNTITDINNFRQELNKIKKQEYAIDNEENEENIVCIGTAIRDYTNKVVGALSITLTLYSKKIKKPEFYKDLVINAAKDISYKLGYVEKINT